MPSVRFELLTVGTCMDKKSLPITKELLLLKYPHILKSTQSISKSV